MPDLTTSDQPSDRAFDETATVAPRGSPAFDATIDATGPGEPLAGGAPPNIPGYEFEAELGRGGMGVVYKARNLKLNRPVAIKMILGGRYANPTARVRFLFEAEAIAQLQHPGVVQVYEVGEHDGLPFFALEYVDGGTLAEKLRRKGRMPARAAARMLATLGDAAAAAHARGIVHRDLKPGNVLLQNDERGAMSDESKHSSFNTQHSSIRPKIADFGLAKVGPSDMTASGAVMGTPSYMSPEQAAGKVREVGPASDIWALGVILYECLTGRPPFRGETPMDTVHQVMTSDPARLRSIIADIPRDLETICLKCLVKEVPQRYATAADFANDLRAFLEGRPIAARPVGSFERGWKWARRRPGAAAALAGSVLAVAAFVIVVATFNVRLHEQRDAALRDRDSARIAREQALANFRLARRAVDVYTKKIVEDRRLRGFGLDEVRREWLRDGSEFYREFARQDLDDPTIEVERARAYFQLAEITATINGAAESLDLYRQAREIQERLAAEQPDEPEHRLDLSATINGEAAAYLQLNKRVEARQKYDQCIALRAELARERPTDVKYIVGHGAAWNNLGQMLKEGDAEQAENAFRTAERLLAEVPPGQLNEAGDDPAIMRVVVNVNLAGLLINRGRLVDAESSLRAMVKLETTPNGPPDARAAFGLAWFALANVEMKTERMVDAEKSLLAALDHLDPVAVRFPGVLDFQNSSAATRMMLGTLYLNGERFAEAEKVLRTAVERLEPLTRLEPNNRQYQGNLLSGYLALAHVHGAMGQPREAESILLAALTLVEGLLERPEKQADYREKQSSILRLLGQIYAANNRGAEAEAHFRRNLANLETLNRDHPSSEHTVLLAGGLIELGRHLASTKPDEALTFYNRAEQELRGVLKTDPAAENAEAALRTALANRAALRNGGKLYAGAVADREQVVALLTAKVARQPTPANRYDLADAIERLARAQQQTGKDAAALANFRRCIQQYESVLTDRPNDPDYQVALADAAAVFALALDETKDRIEAEATFRRAIQVYDGLLAKFPDRAGSRVDLGGVHCNLGNLLGNGPKRAEALEHYGRAVAHLRGVLDDAAGTPAERRRAQTYLRNSHSSRSMLLERQKRPAEAAADQTEVVAYWLRQPAGDLVAQKGLAAALERLGDLYFAANQLGPAAAAYGRTETALEQVIARDPKAAAPRARLALVLEFHGKALGASSEFAQAIPYFEKAIALREDLTREFPKGEHNQGSLPDLSALLAKAYIVTNAPEKGEATLVRVAGIRRSLAKANPKVAAHHEGLADALQVLGLSYSLRSDFKQAEPVFREAAAAWDQYLKTAAPADVERRREHVADGLHGLGEACLRLLKFEEAASAFVREADIRQTMATAAIARDGGEKPSMALARGGCLANAALALQKVDAARSLEPYSQAIAVLRKVSADDPANATARQYLRNAVGGRANSLGKLKRYKEALPDWDWLLEIGPLEQIAESRTSRSLVLARIGEHVRASAEVEELVARADAGRLYNLACTLAICAHTVTGNQALSEKYAARSVVLLRQAMTTGYFKGAGRVEHLKADSDLDPLRGRVDFRTFVTDLIATPAGPPIEKAPVPRVVEK
jgi:tetratricopeptide (TPR) repeat protein/tRNA A-37 threonylcarbamoyl transferase component Bud32